MKPQIAAITIPLVPPSVNHYWKRKRYGGYFVSEEGEAFLQAVALYAKRQKVRAKAYHVEVWIYLGRKQKGDVDNFAKCVLDGLRKAGVIDSDAKITDLDLHKRRDIANPRTEIMVEAL
jgi:Holliday junction resolvase RusA-like endonuclease